MVVFGVLVGIWYYMIKTHKEDDYLIEAGYGDIVLEPQPNPLPEREGPGDRDDVLGQSIYENSSFDPTNPDVGIDQDIIQGKPGLAVKPKLRDMRQEHSDAVAVEGIYQALGYGKLDSDKKEIYQDLVIQGVAKP